jgi:hypothetical protein
MGGIKRTPADDAFSKCTRERANWTCEKCNKYFPEGYRQGLDCSHHYGRRAWAIRLEPMNSEALCYGCHSHYGGTEDRRNEVLSSVEIGILVEKREDVSLAKEARKTKGKGAVAMHFREELKRMKELRAQGETGRIEFVGWF